jgi:hypothetical protein
MKVVVGIKAPKHLSTYRCVPIGIGTYGGPTEEQQASPKPEIPGSRHGATTPCRLNKS